MQKEDDRESLITYALYCMKGRNNLSKNNDMSLFCKKCPDQLIETQAHIIPCGGVTLEINYTDLVNSNLNKVKPALILIYAGVGAEHPPGTSGPYLPNG